MCQCDNLIMCQCANMSMGCTELAEVSKCVNELIKDGFDY